jgi:arylsulfatase A-like enzyme
MIDRGPAAAGRVPAALLLCSVAAVLMAAPRLVAAAAPPSAAPAAPAQGATPAPERPGGVVLITVDGLRADRVGCYTGGAYQTPGIDALAAAGTRFDRAYAASPSTGPSNATILTGLRPAHHGWRRDHAGRVALGTPSLARRFQAAGWYTAAIVGTRWLNSEFGLYEGFAKYEDDMTGIRKEHLRSSPERRAAEGVDLALRTLDGAPPGKRVFLWLNLHDPDYDYDPPEPQKSAFASDPYQGEIAAADAGVAALVAGLEARGLLKRTTVVVAGSHGEGLSEHGELAHGTLLYETTIRVPLVFAGPGIAADGRRLEGPIGLADVAPTLLELAGLSHDGLDGRSRAGLIAAATPWPEAKKRAAKEVGPVFAEAVHPLEAFGWSPVATVIEGTLKVVQGARLETFDLEADPKEEHPIARLPRRTGEMARLASSLLQPLGPDPERRRRIDASIAKTRFPWDNSPFCAAKTDHPDPRDPDRVAEAAKLFLMQTDVERGLIGYAWIKAQDILESDPSNLAALEAETQFGLVHGWGDLLLDPLELMVCHYPYQTIGYHQLGHFYTGRREWQQARDAFGLMMLVEPENQEAEYDFACTLLALGDLDGGLEHLKRSIDLGGDDYDIIRRDPRVGRLFNDPRFKALLPPR